MRIFYLRYSIIFLFIAIQFIFSQECDSGFIWIEDIPSCCGAPAEHCFFESDLQFLQDLIDNSSETINMLLDDNENGVMEAVELGFTEWEGGRLIALDCFLSDIMNCNLSGPIPESIGNLEYLEAIWLNGNQLIGEIPESIGNLPNLELLYLSDNNLSGIIPDSICDLEIDFHATNNWGVEYFNIWGNQLCPPYPECFDSNIVGAQSCSEFSGDVNSDGSTDVIDIIIIANLILNNSTLDVADVNQDGNIDILDIVTIVVLILE